MQMVSIPEILSHVNDTKDSYDVGLGPHEWFRMIREKMGDGQTPAIIRAIESEGFTDPICIEVTRFRHWRLGNGHHRLAIAILLGLDEIPVDFSGWFTSASHTNSHKIVKSRTYEDEELADWISHTAVSLDDMCEDTYL